MPVDIKAPYELYFISLQCVFNFLLQICVPRLGSLSDTELTEADFESHILITEPDSYHAYKTVNKKVS